MENMNRQTYEATAEEFERAIVGFTVRKVYTCINAAATGVWIELTKKIDNVVIGITVAHDPENICEETSYEVSKEYVVEILPREQEER